MPNRHPLHPRPKSASGIFLFSIVPMVNLLFLLYMFSVITPHLIFPVSVQIYLPKTITSDIVPDQTITISVSGEDLIYFENKIVTERELKELLRNPSMKEKRILIKADRRSSLARMIDIWNLCKASGIGIINVATTTNK